MNHPRPIAAQHQVTAETLPEGCQTLNRAPEIHRAAGQTDGVDRPGRGADDYRERIVCPQRQQFGNRRQYADLISRPSPAAGKNQPCNRFSRTHRNAPWCLMG
ncbi:hypothetical protein D9M68_993100 [compost metagenome]